MVDLNEQKKLSNNEKEIKYDYFAYMERIYDL
jgi:hypothetical protein